MRVLLLTLALCCLVHHATPQTLSDSVTAGGVTFNIYAAATALDLANGDPCPTTENLAVFESEEEYKAVIEAMITGSVADGEIMVGLRKSSNDAAVRTSKGGRLAPYVNFKDSPDVTAALADSRWSYMDFQSTNTALKYADFLHSPWSLGNLLLATGDLFMCMEREDPNCVVDDCARTARDDREVNKTCFWRPDPYTQLSWYEANKECFEHGGHLMDLIDDEDIVRIKDWSDEYPSWGNLWLGLNQGPDEGHPTWWKGELVDEQDAWQDPINYGSSSNYLPYAGIWHTGSEDMNLYETGDGANGVEHKAFATCEATKEDYCKYSSKDVKYADKSVCCDGEKLRYTCKSGWEFPDGDIEKEIECGCDVVFDQYIPNCILKNPCLDHVARCPTHGECIFTNQAHKPYYCNCEAGFIWDDAGHNCVKERYPTQPPVAAVHTMTMYFHVNMNYDPHMIDPSYEEYDHFMEALQRLTQAVYHQQGITVDSFHVEQESFGKMKVKVVFNIYIAADVTTVSKYSWMFYTYIKNADYFTVNSNTYLYYGSVYFKSSTVSKEITITSVCSIFESIGQCHGSYCAADGYTPKCHCRKGYYGVFCNEYEPDKPLGPGLTDTEIGLIVAVCILFLMVICMPFCLLCCIQNCRGMQSRKRAHHHDHEHFTNNAYGSPTYVSKQVTRYPNFRFN